MTERKIVGKKSEKSSPSLIPPGIFILAQTERQ